MKFKYFEISELDPKARDRSDSNGRWLKSPDFIKIIWPYFVDNSGCLSEIFLFSHKGSKVKQKRISKITEIIDVTPEDFMQINSLDKLEKKAVDELKFLCNYSGHLNVFFYTEDFNFPKGLCGLFPWPGKFVNKELLIKENEDNLRLRQFIDRILNRGYLIALAEEANFIAIWGDEESLNKTTEIY